MVKRCVTCAAALVLVFPAWLAATLQVPPAIPLTVLPETLQIPVVRLLKVTVKPDVAVALSVPVPPTSRAGAAPKVIVWLTLSMLKFCVICGAALVLPLPA